MAVDLRATGRPGRTVPWLRPPSGRGLSRRWLVLAGVSDAVRAGAGVSQLRELGVSRLRLLTRDAPRPHRW
ncbi:hypothetical protein ACF09C_11440 [Streptomyces sp. NPDC014870]|uniref:hypothetical protein n=1 Tax=Streptomyces sp. NPDC014870 TaxID=3364925 RepID=UPI0036FF8EFB